MEWSSLAGMGNKAIVYSCLLWCMWQEMIKKIGCVDDGGVGLAMTDVVDETCSYLREMADVLNKLELTMT